MPAYRLPSSLRIEVREALNCTDTSMLANNIGLLGSNIKNYHQSSKSLQAWTGATGICGTLTILLIPVTNYDQTQCC